MDVMYIVIGQDDAGVPSPVRVVGVGVPIYAAAMMVRVQLYV